MENVKFLPATPLHESAFYPGYSPGTAIFRKASIVKEGHLPLPCDILRERDIAVTLRDGTRLFVDVYRPPNAKPGSLPAIFVFTPYGKQGGPNRHNFDTKEWRFGVPRKIVSGLEAFEGPDPAYWCLHGYAIVCVDMRGTWNSEDNFVLPCTQQGKDGYDVIEWIATQPWSNGHVSMAGNSFLAAVQWFVGAENPPHLSCLAPWEGFNDLYNDLVQKGGIPDAGNREGSLRGDIAAKGLVEDIFTMANGNPLWNSYWESRCANWAKISVPLYVVASWTNANHTRGTLRGFSESASENKWLRVHNAHEWPDLYQPQNVESLRSFFDHYMKNANNDWIYTPRVRLSILNPGGSDIINRPEDTYPLERQKPLQLFLDADSRSLRSTSPEIQSKRSYSATSGAVTFDYQCPQAVEFVGSAKLRLFVEAQGSNDMDLFVKLSKHNFEGKIQRTTIYDVGWLADDPDAERAALIAGNEKDPTFCANFFNSGPTGFLRASHRGLNVERSTTFQPIYTHKEEQLLQPGDIVPVDVEIWPYGWRFDAGDRLRLTVQGEYPSQSHLRPTDRRPVLRNKGEHVIHTGGDTNSFLVLPLTWSS